VRNVTRVKDVYLLYTRRHERERGCVTYLRTRVSVCVSGSSCVSAVVFNLRAYVCAARACEVSTIKYL
jgi:hypothetical protein